MNQKLDKLKSKIDEIIEKIPIEELVKRIEESEEENEEWHIV